MLLRWMNWLAGLFGYQWVKDVRPHRPDTDFIDADDGWDDLAEHQAKYRLVKRQPKND